MKERIKMIKKGIEDLRKDVNKKQFAKELYKEQKNGHGPTIIYFDTEYLGIFCETLQKGYLIEHFVYLGEVPPCIDFDEMSKREYEIYVEDLIESLDYIYE